MLRNYSYLWRSRMPPKPIISRDDLISTAIQLIRENGMDSINARSLAKALDCSTKPLFRIYKNMEELKRDIIVELNAYYNSFMDSKMQDDNRLLSQSIAYIEFARKEKKIFNTLFMNKTMAGASLEDIVNAEWNRLSIENAKLVTGLPLDKAEMLFINIWLYSHGIATQIVSNDIKMSFNTITELMTDAFKRFSTNI